MTFDESNTQDWLNKGPWTTQPSDQGGMEYV